MYFWNVLTRCFCIEETTHRIPPPPPPPPHERPPPAPLYWGLYLKVIQTVDKGCWVPKTSVFHMQNPSQSNSKHQSGTLSKRLWHSRMQFFFLSLKRDKLNLVAILFLLEAFLGFNTTLSFGPVSLIWEIVKTTTDGTWNWLMSSILYWRRECRETLIKAEATV